MAAAAASPGMTLIPEPPVPDGDSPRVQAAMNVLGILPQELDKTTLEENGFMEPRYELFENKRRILMGQVGDMASRSPDALQVFYNSEEAPKGNPNGAFMAKVLAAEQRNFDRMALKAKKDVQKIVLEELEAKLTLHNAGKRMEEGAQRVKAMKKARDDQLAALKKEAQKRAERNAEVRNRAAKHMEEEAQELLGKLDEANTRAANKLSEIAAGHEEMRVKGQERQAQIGERNARLEQQQLRHRERQYDGIVAKHEAKMERLEHTLLARQCMSEATLQRHEDSMERVRQHWEKKQQKTEERYSQILKRHEGAKVQRETVLAGQIKEYTTRNAKERNGFVNRYERIQKELDEHPNISRRLQQSGDAKVFERSLSDSQISALSMRSHHRDLVGANRERLRRAHHHAQEQQLSKIESMRQRVDIMQNSKADADRRRTIMIKNCAIEKFHLEEAGAKADSLRRLQEMDPEPQAAARIREIMTALGMEKLLSTGEEADKA
mmetsp:Transcript_59444/g.173980  ORF Transcript_59444/g.173980 Transcript_59444/m.173980 type:complete len:495 (+) Transcript_59444:73-1557(+)